MFNKYTISCYNVIELISSSYSLNNIQYLNINKYSKNYMNKIFILLLRK